MTSLVRTIAFERPFMLLICRTLRSELGLSTETVYLPAGSVLLPTVNVNGILAITRCALVWAFAAIVNAVVRMMIARGKLNNRFMISLRVFSSTFSLHLFTRRFHLDSLTGLKHLL